jgi:hypothetical protein
MPSNSVNLVGGLRGGEMRVSIPPDEVTTRLQAELDPEPPVRGIWGYRLYRKHRFYGRAALDSFCIRQWSLMRRLDDPVLMGTICPDGEGSIIRFEVRPAKGSLIFLAVFAVLWVGIWLLVPAASGFFFADWGIWGKLGIAAAAIPLVAFFWWLLRSEANALLGFLEERCGDVKLER